MLLFLGGPIKVMLTWVLTRRRYRFSDLAPSWADSVCRPLICGQRSASGVSIKVMLTWAPSLVAILGSVTRLRDGGRLGMLPAD